MADFAVVLLHPAARVPARGSAGAAGYDLSASEDASVPARGRAAIPTGIAIRVPPDHYARVAPRSGLAVKGMAVGAGVVDSDYTGEVKVVLFNHTDDVFVVRTGDRVAQLVFERISTPDLRVVAAGSFEATMRGAAGFGSTGV